jgi:hypothetical protein
MPPQTQLLLKLLLLSTALSFAIKYLAPHLHIAMNATNVLIAITLPSLVLALLLLWRGRAAPQIPQGSPSAENEIN